MKVLVTDGIHADATKYLESNGITVDDKSGISREELLGIVDQYDGLIIRSRTVPDEELIGKASQAKIICRVGSGTNHINVPAATEKGITVVNSPGANSQAVAEQTIAMMVSLMRNLGKAHASMRNGEWIKNDLKGNEIYGKTVGIIGLGFVGSKVQKILEAFGAKVLTDEHTDDDANFENLMRTSDIVTVHVPLLDETRDMIGENEFAMMKDSAIFINTSRGEVVVEDALYEALTSGKIAGAGLDVFWDEPLAEDSRWRKLDNVFLTPHICASTHEAQLNASMMIAEDIVRLSKGENVENKVG